MFGSWQLAEWSIYPFAGLQTFFTLLWAVISAPKWWRNYQYKLEETRRIAERERQRIEQRRREEEEEAYIASLREWLGKLTSPEFAKGFSNSQGITIYYLNPAKELRVVDARTFTNNRFHPEDQPRCWVVAVKYKHHYEGSPIYTSYFLKWFTGQINWRIREWEKAVEMGGTVRLADHIQEDVPLSVGGTESEKITQVLRFVTAFTSRADFTLKTIAKYGVPVLKESKATKGDSGAARLRIALQLEGRIFENGTGDPFQDLLDRDPEKAAA